MVDSQRLTDVLVRLAGTLREDCPPQRLLDIVVEELPAVVPVVAASGLLLAGRHAAPLVSGSDPTLLRLQRAQLELDEGPTIACIAAGRPVADADLPASARYPRWARLAVSAGLSAADAVPLVVDGVAVGALAGYHTSARGLGPADVAAAATLADAAAAHVRNARVRAAAQDRVELLRQQALHDPLTGLPNRVLLHDRLQVAMAKARRSGGSVAVLFVDLDEFKAVNDSYGHVAGDAILAAVAQRLRAVLRPGDTLARLGGDEFVVLCEDLTDPGVAERLAARVAGALRDPFPVPDRDEPGGKPALAVAVTASVGVAYAGSGAQMPEVLLRDADAAMYEAKKSGGARYVATGSVVRSYDPAEGRLWATG